MMTDFNGDIRIDGKHHPRAYVIERFCTYLAAFVTNKNADDILQIIKDFEQGKTIHTPLPGDSNAKV